MASFTGNNQSSSVLHIGPFDTVQWTLSVAGGDTMTATVAFQKSPNGFDQWETITTTTSVGSGTYHNDRDKELYLRLRTTAHSGDDVVWALTISDDRYDTLTFRNSDIRSMQGETAVSIRKGAVTFPQDVVVDGSLTVSGLNLSTASEDVASVAGAATYTPSWTSPTHSIVTMTGSTCTIANNSGTPTGAMPYWLTIINSSGVAVDLQSNVTFGAAYEVDARGHILANGESTTMAFFWDATNSKCRQVESQPDSIDVDGNIVSGGEVIATSLNATTSGVLVDAGGVTVTDGAVDIQNGNLDVSGAITGDSLSASTVGTTDAVSVGTDLTVGTTVTAGTGITATTGNIAASSGNVTASAAMSAGTTVTAGTGITATTGNIAASSGNVTASGLISAGTTITAGTGLTVTTGNLGVSSGTVSASGNITTSGGKFTGQNGDAYTWYERNVDLWDYTKTELNETSATWLELDISSIIGAQSVPVYCRLFWKSSSTSATTGIVGIGAGGYVTGSLSNCTLRVGYTAATALEHGLQAWVLSDAGGSICYRGGTSITDFNIHIVGWLEPA